MTTRDQPMITLAAADRATAAAVDFAAELGVAIVAAVVDPAAHPVSMRRMDGAPMLSIDVAVDKAWTVAAFGQSTEWWAELLAAEPSLGALGSNNRLMPIPGGVPIVVDGAVVGAIGVSGATAEQDRDIAHAGAEAASE